MVGKDAALDVAQDEIEGGMSLVGSTAIEDKLQENVEVTIDALKAAGI